MDESFLKYVWKFKLLKAPLETVDGQEIQIIHTGVENFDSGPDFLDARLKIGDTVWAGNVEIHVKSSDWDKHGHQNDPAYNSVILHVVYDNDSKVYNSLSREIVNLKPGNSFPADLYSNYNKFFKSSAKIACAGLISSVSEVLINSRLTRLAVERFERKALKYMIEAEAMKWDWEEIFYRILARAFGGKVNADAFYRLACITPLRTIARERSSLHAAEAILYGQAGLLSKELKDAYPAKLYKSYNHYTGKYDLKPMESHVFRFMRIHPPGFPTIRISQFAGLISKNYPMFRAIVEMPVSSITDMFRVKASEYWDKHYIFDESSGDSIKNLGADASSVIIINAVIPVLFLYGHYKKDDAMKQKAIDVLLELGPENNKITRQWADYGIGVNNAVDSQGLIELKTMYCDSRQCLRCGFGHYLLANKIL